MGATTVEQGIALVLFVDEVIGKRFDHVGVILLLVLET